MRAGMRGPGVRALLKGLGGGGGQAAGGSSLAQAPPHPAAA